MNVFALSDIHLDYDDNRRWLEQLSTTDYREDVLILAGDVAEELRLLAVGFRTLVSRFRKVLFVPGNHDLWVRPTSGCATSFEKFAQVEDVATGHGVALGAYHVEGLSIVPLLGWYDFTFGEPSAEVLGRWMDFRECRWPDGVTVPAVADHFFGLNAPVLGPRGATVISFSHFLPRIDVMPRDVPQQHRWIYPVLGSSKLGEEVRRLGSAIHVYGHSHVNRDVLLDGTRYINNAYGYPGEEPFAAKRLQCIFST